MAFAMKATAPQKPLTDAEVSDIARKAGVSESTVEAFKGYILRDTYGDSDYLLSEKAPTTFNAVPGMEHLLRIDTDRGGVLLPRDEVSALFKALEP